MVMPIWAALLTKQWIEHFTVLIYWHTIFIPVICLQRIVQSNGCLVVWDICLCIYLHQRDRRLLERQIYDWATVYQYDRKAETWRLKLIRATDIKAKGVDHRDQHWDKGGWSEHAVVHMFSCVLLCVRKERRRDDEEELLWKLSQHHHLVSHWTVHNHQSTTTPSLLPFSTLLHPHTGLTFWTKWHYQIITFLHVFLVQLKHHRIFW